jgi:hypothetical protein
MTKKTAGQRGGDPKRKYLMSELRIQVTGKKP